MASSVAPSAPFIVMPRATDALNGEMTTFSPALRAFTARKRASEKSLLAAIVWRSPAVRARGSVSRRGCEPGPAGSRQATPAARRRTSGASGRRTADMAAPVGEGIAVDPTTGQCGHGEAARTALLVTSLTVARPSLAPPGAATRRKTGTQVPAPTRRYLSTAPQGGAKNCPPSFRQRHPG